jgi:predicted transcriptional regulator
MADKARLTLDLDPELHRKLKVLAAQRRTSMREICLEAIRRQIEGPVIALAPDDLLTELWDNEEDAVYDDL